MNSSGGSALTRMRPGIARVMCTVEVPSFAFFTPSRFTPSCDASTVSSSSVTLRSVYARTSLESSHHDLKMPILRISPSLRTDSDSRKPLLRSVNVKCT
jgi:hypothetical protein